MKLLIVWHAGGVESYWKRILELSKKFAEVKMLVPEHWNEGGKVLSSRNTSLTTNCEIVAGKTMLNFHGSTHFYVTSLFRTLNEYRPNVIHIHEEPWSLAALQVIVCHKLLHIKAKIIVDSAAISLHKKPIFSWIEAFVYRHADLVYARNSEVKKILKERGCNKPIYVLPNGVDTGLFKGFEEGEVTALREQNGVKADEKVVGYIGRMIKEKGVYDFLDAAKALIADNCRRYKFLIIGSGEERENIARFLADNDLADRFIILEKVPPAEVPIYMNMIDLLVLPSRTTRSWKEQFGRVLVEAMACGKPVVGSSSGAIPEVINNGKLIFPEGDSVLLAQKVREVLEDQALLKEAVSNSRERVEQLYSWEALSDYYVDVLREQRMMDVSYGGSS